MSPDKLVHMINQIAQFHARQPEAEAAKNIAVHLKRFWDPRMRAAIAAFVTANGEGLLPAAHRAVENLMAEAAPKA